MNNKYKLKIKTFQEFGHSNVNIKALKEAIWRYIEDKLVDFADLIEVKNICEIFLGCF